MSDNSFSSSNIPPVRIDPSQTQQTARSAAQTSVLQEESQEGFLAFIDEGAFSPTLMARRFETLEIRRRGTSKEEEVKEKTQDRILAVRKIEETAEQLNKKNPELHTRSLLLLRSQLKASDTKEEILDKVLEMYTDHTLADEALDFLLDTTDGELARQVSLAKEALNEKHAKEIKAGRNIANQTSEFAAKGLGTPQQLRAVYKEVTGNPRDANGLFEELSSNFTYEKMKTLIDFLLSSLGSDLKSKGPSIDRGELHRLLSETRKLQAILWIFRFFKSRMNLIGDAFQKQGLKLTFTFDILAKQFMKAIQERYPSAEKILQLAAQLGLSEELVAQVIIFTQMRDGLRQVAPKLFRSNQHRQDLLNAFIDAIEDLDEKLEEDKEKDS
jgi:type III secretion protein W